MIMETNGFFFLKTGTVPQGFYVQENIQHNSMAEHENKENDRPLSFKGNISRITAVAAEKQKQIVARQKTLKIWTKTFHRIPLYDVTPIPHFMRILVPGKNHVTWKSGQWDCANVSTNGKFPH